VRVSMKERGICVRMCVCVRVSECKCVIESEYERPRYVYARM
jgi:hypothetical protein